MTGPSAFAVHGVRVDVHDEGVPGNPASLLLKGFPFAAPASVAGLEIRLALCPGGVAWKDEVASLEPTFFHSHVRAYADGAGVVFCDGASILRINESYDAIDGQLAPASLTDLETLVSLPMYLTFITAMRAHGLFHLHAGAVRLPDGRGCLIVGTGGAGKSTLTTAFAVGGCQYLGDDVQFLRLADDHTEVLAFPRPFHVGDSTARAFPHLAEFLDSRPGRAKHHLDHRSAFPGQQAWHLEPSVVLFPRIADRTRVTPLPDSDTLAALFESSAFFAVDHLPATRQHITALERVALAARGFDVTLGSDLLEDPSGQSARLVGELTSR